MKRFWKMAGVATLVAILGVAALGTVAYAQDDEGSPFDFRAKFREAVASALGVSVEEYDAAVDQAQEQVVGDAVAEGWLTEEQAELLQWRTRPGSPPDRFWAWFLDYAFNRIVLRAVQDGRLRPPTGLGLSPHGPLIDSSDFIGLNYYTRSLVAFEPGQGELLGVRRFPKPGAEVSDSGRHGTYGEIYPQGIYRALMRVARLGKPIYVTETGLPDADDDQRPRFLVTHLSQVARAIADGADVRGLYHWSLTDNFEWAEGWALRFGLIALDEKTQQRTVRPSGRLFAAIAAENGLTREMMREHAPEMLMRPHSSAATNPAEECDP